MALALIRPVHREVPGSRDTRGRPIVLRAAPEGLYVREKGRRTWLGPLAWSDLYGRAARLEGDRLLRERRAARKAKRAARARA